VKALILAAGEGTRLRPLTLDRPKPMVPLGGRPLLEYLVGLVRHHGVTQVAINLHYRPERITEFFGDGRHGVAITYSPEEQLLGSAGAARKLREFLDEPFFVLYGDVLTDMDLTALAERHRVAGAMATVALHEVPDPERCGIAQLGHGGQIVRFVEKPPASLGVGNLANTGIYVVEPAVLDLVPDGIPFDFGTHLFPQLIDLGHPLLGVRTDAYVKDIGSIDRYTEADADLRAHRVRTFVQRHAVADGRAKILTSASRRSLNGSHTAFQPPYTGAAARSAEEPGIFAEESA
jgi:NDP-sugar pyrophosphorylase family protein